MEKVSFRDTFYIVYTALIHRYISIQRVLYDYYTCRLVFGKIRSNLQQVHLWKSVQYWTTYFPAFRVAVWILYEKWPIRRLHNVYLCKFLDKIAFVCFMRHQRYVKFYFSCIWCRRLCSEVIYVCTSICYCTRSSWIAVITLLLNKWR